MTSYSLTKQGACPTLTPTHPDVTYAVTCSLIVHPLSSSPPHLQTLTLSYPHPYTLTSCALLPHPTHPHTLTCTLTPHTPSHHALCSLIQHTSPHDHALYFLIQHTLTPSPHALYSLIQHDLTALPLHQYDKGELDAQEVVENDVPCLRAPLEEESDEELAS